jgi:hypothetical protein
MTRWLPRWRTATNPFCSRIRQTSDPERTRSLPNRDLNLSHENLAARAPGDFGRGGVSKNSVSASMRLARASSMDASWLAMSNSGHNATKTSSSRSIIAVKRCAGIMIRVYPVPYERVVGMPKADRLGPIPRDGDCRQKRRAGSPTLRQAATLRTQTNSSCGAGNSARSRLSAGSGRHRRRPEDWSPAPLSSRSVISRTRGSRRIPAHPDRKRSTCNPSWRSDSR